MINPLLLLTGEPIKINKNILVYQPVLKDIAIIGEELFGALISIWFLNRKDLIEKENDETWNLSDFDVYKKFILYDKVFQDIFKQSVLFFLHKNVEFLKMQNTIFIGELESGIELTEELFLQIRSAIGQIIQRTEDKKKNAPSSKKAQEIQAKIDKAQEKLKEIKAENGQNQLAKQISAFVAHSNKGYDEVFGMTLIQFSTALEKIVQIENYTISVMLSPNMDKKHKSKITHWLE